MLERDGVAGVSFDLELFADLLSCGAEYAEELDALLGQGLDAAAIIDELLRRDVESAAGVLTPVYERSDGRGGWLALDVPGYVEPSIDAVGSWFAHQVEDAPNVMLKLPANATGLSLGESMLARGYGVCFTHVLSPAQVLNALNSLARGLRLARTAGHDLGRIPGLMSMPLLRVDVAVNEALRDLARREPDAGDLAESLIGRASIAVAKIAWGTVREAMAAPRWADLVAAGARRPRLAWHATRTSDPRRRPNELVEELIGPDTVTQMSPSVLAAFREHGVVSPRLARHLDEAGEIVDDLATAGVELEELAAGLQAAAVKQERQRVAALCNLLEARRESGGGAPFQAARMSLAALAEPVSTRVEGMSDSFVERLWAADPTLWATDPETQAAVRNRLGWLFLPESMREEALPIVGLGPTVGKDTSVVLLGMGGSSLGAEACRIAYEIDSFTVLDTTVPRGVAAVAAGRDLESSVFVVGSKSGSTIETACLADYFHDRVAGGSELPGERFIAITDPGTPLHEQARNLGYARVWLNPPDVGGRFSVLSYFGLVPMALMGIDVPALLGRAARFAALCAPEVKNETNPALLLGATLAEAAAGGLDKITFLTRPRLSAFADWAEQLIAESLGKQGGGPVPVSGEPHGSPGDYGADRLFVHMRFASDDLDAEPASLLEHLCAAGHPMIEITLADPHDLGAEFLRWELAVAVAGALMGINPFDEPNVSQAKERTGELLAHFESEGALPDPVPLYEDELLALYGSAEFAPDLANSADWSLQEWLERYLAEVRVPDYVGLQAFLAPDLDTWHALQGLRALLRDRLGVATTMGWGPRFLHSTGQLHKGGPDTGVFVQLTADDTGDLPIPGRSYSFGVLVRAQALGDLTALQDRGRPVLRVHLRKHVESGLAALLEAARGALGTPARKEVR